MACEGLKPVVAIYSTFLQRAYDQLIHDVALQNLPVVFALDRAGLVGADGATHAGAYDIAFLRCIPNMSLACPSDEAECRQLLSTAYAQDHPVAVRYPRGAGVGADSLRGWKVCHLARPKSAAMARRGDSGLRHLVAPGLGGGRAPGCHGGRHALGQAAGSGCAARLAGSHSALVTVEEGCIMGGAGSAVLEALQAEGLNLPVLQLGCPTLSSNTATRPASCARRAGCDGYRALGARAFFGRSGGRCPRSESGHLTGCA